MSSRHDATHRETTRALALCPYCGSEETEPLAMFGQQLLTVQMYCQRCHTPFEFVKDDAILDLFAARDARKGEQ